MSQPVKLSDTLVLDARIAGDAQQRSIAGQVEYWARLGRVLELTLDGRQALNAARASNSVSLAALLDSVETDEGHDRLRNYLDSQPYPHFEALAEDPTLLVRYDKQGKTVVRTVGRFVNRVFVEVAVQTAKRDGAATPRKAVKRRA